ncbi:ATP-binding cassette domain-containing protein, partial [Klebsiella pneumoniae]|uniref:ATP-binding cassette domain-containing protein n=1 Tax=Klebsiella pneumoniae TaxID=573 RepID=UPI003127C68E
MQPDEGLFTRQLPGDRFREQTDPVLQLENINVSFDGFRALTDLSLAIGVGELRCVIGPNGAGKTTLMDVITGKTRPQSGKALYDQSVDLTTLDPVAIARQGIGRKFQKPTVFEALTVAENLALAMKGDKSVWASLRARMRGGKREPQKIPPFRIVEFFGGVVRGMTTRQRLPHLSEALWRDA